MQVSVHVLNSNVYCVDPKQNTHTNTHANTVHVTRKVCNFKFSATSEGVQTPAALINLLPSGDGGSTHTNKPNTHNKQTNVSLLKITISAYFVMSKYTHTSAWI